MTVIRLEHLTKRFGDLVAVNDLNLTINHGEFVCFLGPSGSGKTTLLRMIAGLETPTKGEIYFDDERVTDLPTPDRDIAMVFQFPAIYPSLTVYENIAVPLRAEGLSADEIRKRVLWAAEMMGIKQYLNYRYGQLDMGTLQRVSIAKAIVRRPRVFLFDEPLSNLDAKLRDSLRYQFKKIHAEIKQTMIYVTHDQLEAMALADRIAILKDGILQQYDTPENIFYHPVNKFVAYFIGSPTINFIDATLHISREKAYAEFGGATIDLGEIKDLLVERIGETTKDYILGIRPQHITISFEEIPNSFRSKVTTVESMGTSSLIELSRDNILFKALWEGSFPKKPGDEVWVQFDQNMIRVIDKKTEKVLI